ncbi:MAG: diguanylate cyclase [Burkholderiaceae bacterium]
MPLSASPTLPAAPPTPAGPSAASAFNVTAQDVRNPSLEGLWEFVFRCSPIPALISDLDTGEIITGNDEFYRLMGRPAQDIDGKTSVEVGIWPDYQEREKTIGLLRLHGRVRNHEVQNILGDQLFTMLISMEPLSLNGRACILTKYVDITERKKLEQALEQMVTAVEQADEAIAVLDATGRILTANPSFTTLTGYQPADFTLQPIDLLLNIPTQHYGPGLFQRITTDLGHNGSWKGELWAARKNGTQFVQWLSLKAVHREHDNRINYVAVFTDYSERRRYEEELKRLALHDHLTDLPNRALLSEHLERAVHRADRHDLRVAVLFADLDNFKYVNDNHGHETGDELLKQVAGRLRQVLRADDVVARMGGDEFVIVIEGPSVDRHARRVAEKLVSELERPFYLNGITTYIGTSVGIALWPEHGRSASDLLRRADEALYRAKANGKNGYAIWSPKPAE